MATSIQQTKQFIEVALSPKRLNLYRGLSETVSFLQDHTLSEEDLIDYVTKATEDEILPLVSFIDAAHQADEASIVPTTNTKANSPERLKWIIDQLKLGFVAEQIASRLPKPAPIVIVEEDFRDWYTPQRAARHTNYWNNYVEVLSRNGWDGESIATVSNQATEVLRRIEDPYADHYISSRGLVVGYVQSGKTANFTAVAAKAIDAGYRMIIILAGTLDNLRNQTQRRLDKELCGKESVLDGRVEGDMSDKDLKDESYFVDDEEWMRPWHEKGGAFISHGPTLGSPGFPRIRRLTTSIKDYQHQATANPIEITRPFKEKKAHDPDNLDNMPCFVAVVKKNASVLKNLNADLKRAARSGDLKDLPVLVIDDESDQASINTKDNRKLSADEERERTAVNHEITRILQHCPRAQYVGYTATPFANVFVDPDDPEDLYPRHFVLMLNEPPAYRGARWFHDRMDFADDEDTATVENSQSKAFIRRLVDDASVGDAYFEELRDEELQEALDMFVLTGAIKKYREAKDDKYTFKHHTMLVHEGVSTGVHSDAKSRLDKMWFDRGYNLGRPIPALKSLFEDDLLPVMSIEKYNAGAPVPTSYAELHPFVNQAYTEIMQGVTEHSSPVLQVDTEGKDSPNFEAGRVWKVMVGGAKLSRGYTVEGLTVSYFRRKTTGADTLMQTGRWFGFRKGYQDLVRLYAPDNLIEMFEAAMRDEQAFRENIEAYSRLDDQSRPILTPMHLAPLVQQSLPDLKPTSSNKMFNAYIKSSALAPNAVEFNTIPDARQRKDLAFNFDKVALPLLQKLRPEPAEMAFFRLEGLRTGKLVASAGTKPFYVGTIPAEDFVSLLDKMKWYEGSSYKENIVNPHIEYLRSLLATGKHSQPADQHLREVAIMLPIKKKGGRSRQSFSINIPGLPFEVPLVDRSRREQRHDITGSDRKYTYILENIAAGNPVIEPKPSDLEEFGDYLRSEYKKKDLKEPFDLTPEIAKKRGAVLLTLFDDRDRDWIKSARENGTYHAPSYEKGEVGFALAASSPHAAIRRSKGIVEWGVRLLPKDGNKPNITVDTKDVEDQELNSTGF